MNMLRDINKISVNNIKNTIKDMIELLELCDENVENKVLDFDIAGGYIKQIKRNINIYSRILETISPIEFNKLDHEIKNISFESKVNRSPRRSPVENIQTTAYIDPTFFLQPISREEAVRAVRRRNSRDNF